jgi:hypothetical protein
VVVTTPEGDNVQYVPDTACQAALAAELVALKVNVIVTW